MCSDGDGHKRRGRETPASCGVGVAAGGGGGGDRTPPGWDDDGPHSPYASREGPPDRDGAETLLGTTPSRGGARMENHRAEDCQVQARRPEDLQVEDRGVPCRRTRGARYYTSTS